MRRALAFISDLRKALARHMLEGTQDGSLDSALTHVLKQAYEAGRTGRVPTGELIDDPDVSLDDRADASRFRMFLSSTEMQSRLPHVLTCAWSLNEWRTNIDRVACELRMDAQEESRHG